MIRHLRLGNMRTVVAVLSTIGLVMALSNPAYAGPGDGTVLGATKIVDNGPDAERFNFVIIGEGFTSAQQSSFNSRADQLVAALFGYPPIDTLTEAFNVTRINVASDDSGADEPALCFGSATYVDTYFDATYCASGVRRALVVNNSTVFSVLNTWAPSWDQAIVVVNHTEWGGTGGSVSVTSVAGGWEGIVIHEFGHSAFGFADEYEYYAGCGAETGHDNHPAFEPSQPNVTTETNRELVKWGDLILPSTPLPTTENANCAVCDPQGNPFSTHTVGLYEGARYYHCDCYRPQFSCMMRNLANYFCAVCRAIVEQDLAAYLPAPNLAPVAQCQSVTMPAGAGCETIVTVDDVDAGSFDPEGSGLQRSLQPAGPYSGGVTPVMFIVSDGNLSDTCETTITVVDETPPTAICPSDFEVQLGPDRFDTTLTYSPTFTEECPNPWFFVDPPTGSVFGEGSHTVTCIATDFSGNADTCEFEVSVTLTCNCPFQCDFDQDGFHTSLDLASEIDILFAGQPNEADPGCSVVRADFDCDGFPTSLDLSGLIDLLYSGGDLPCDPCSP